MTESSGLAYATARMQARFGERPTDGTWNHLARINDFGQLLQTLRGTSLAPWVADYGATTGTHQIERGLRARFRHEVDELARWMPRRWHQAVSWFRWLPDLPAVAHIRRGRSTWPWFTQDAIRHALLSDQAVDTAGLDELSSLAARADDDEPLIEVWLQGWRARWPRDARNGSGGLSSAHEQVRQLIDRRAADATAPQALEPALRRLFRRHARQPAGALVYLALLHIQFIRLRGLLLQRRLFQRRLD